MVREQAVTIEVAVDTGNPRYCVGRTTLLCHQVPSTGDSYILEGAERVFEIAQVIWDHKFNHPKIVLNARISFAEAEAAHLELEEST